MKALCACACLVVGLAGCHIFSTALPCGDDHGCEVGVCVDGVCSDEDVDVGEGEGEGEGEGDCVAARVDDFDGASGYLAADVFNPSGSVATARDGTAHVETGVQTGGVEVLLIGPSESLVGRVIEVDFDVSALPDGGSAGLVTKATNALDSDVEVRVEARAVAGADPVVVVTAAHFGDVVFDRVELPFVPGVLPVQLRLDGEHPVVFVDGVRAELVATASVALHAHRLALSARCASTGCANATLASDRLQIFGGCR